MTVGKLTTYLSCEVVGEGEIMPHPGLLTIFCRQKAGGSSGPIPYLPRGGMGKRKMPSLPILALSAYSRKESWCCVIELD